LNVLYGSFKVLKANFFFRHSNVQKIQEKKLLVKNIRFPHKMCALKINWNLFDEKFTKYLNQEINDYIKNMKDIPNFVQNISLKKLSLGSTEPTVEILEISNPKKIELTDFPTSTSNSPAISQTTRKSMFSSLSTLSRRTKKPKYYSLVESILEENKKLPEKEKIIIKIPEPVRRVYPATHIHSSLKSTSKRVFTSNLGEEEEFSENELFESLNEEVSTIKPPSSSEPFNLLKQGILLKVFFGYDGNAVVEVGCEFVLHQPIPNFISYPIQVNISHLVIEGTIVVEIENGNLKVYFERDSKGVLKDFSMSVQFGSGNEENVYLEKHKIEDFLRKEIHKFVKNNLMFPHFFETKLEL
jgi:hypothetical protein